jgi:hypothetical protein
MVDRISVMQEQENGVTLIETEVEIAYDDLKAIKNKAQEFPDDFELEC